MLVLRYVYVLALAVWLGGMVVLGAIVAPSDVSGAASVCTGRGRALAGAVFGTVLQRFHYVAYASGAVLLVTLARWRSSGLDRGALRSARRSSPSCSGWRSTRASWSSARSTAFSGSSPRHPPQPRGRRARRGSSLAAGRRRSAAGPLRSAPSALDAADDDQYRWHAGAALLGSARARALIDWPRLRPDS